MNQLLPVNNNFSSAAVNSSPAPAMPVGNGLFNANQTIQSNIVMLLIMLIQQLLTQIGQQQGQHSGQGQGQGQQANTGTQDDSQTDTDTVQRTAQGALSATPAATTRPVVVATASAPADQTLAIAQDPVPLPRPQPLPTDVTKPTEPAQVAGAPAVQLPLPRPQPLPTDVTRPTEPAQVAGAAAVVAPVVASQPAMVAPVPAVEPVTQSGQKVIDVYLLGGQSNAQGMGSARLENALENVLGEDTDNHKSEVFSFAVVASNLHTQWQANGTDSMEGDGKFYRQFQVKLNDYMANLRKANPDAQINIKGMFWHQGESEALLSTTTTAQREGYGENLTRFIQDVRATTGVADLPFMIGRLSENQSPEKGLLAIQAAQDAVAAADTNAVSVNMDTADAPGVHFSQEGYDTMAALFATSYRGNFVR